MPRLLAIALALLGLVALSRHAQAMVCEEPSTERPGATLMSVADDSVLAALEGEGAQMSQADAKLLRVHSERLKALSVQAPPPAKPQRNRAGICVSRERAPCDMGMPSGPRKEPRPEHGTSRVYALLHSSPSLRPQVAKAAPIEAPAKGPSSGYPPSLFRPPASQIARL